MARIKFGTGGWRAIIGDEFIRANVRLLCGALAQRIIDEGVQDKGIVIGYDRRFLSDVAAQWAAEVFAGAGIRCQVIKVAQAPTPLIMWTVKDRELPYGMAITASHNPALYNGIKVFTAGGKDADEEVTVDVERRMEASSVPGRRPRQRPLRGGAGQGRRDGDRAVKRVYGLDHLPSGHGRHPARQPQGGAGPDVRRVPHVAADHPPDGPRRGRCHQRPPRHAVRRGLPSPTSAGLSRLKRYVVENNCDIGIATDGDADRIGVIDDMGNFLHPNELLVILYYYLLKYKGWNGPVVRNVATTSLLDDVAARFGENLLRGARRVQVDLRQDAGD